MSRITGVKAYLDYSVNLGTAPCDRQLGYQKIGNISQFLKETTANATDTHHRLNGPKGVMMF